MPSAGAAEPGQVRFAHLSPDSPSVDVALAPAPRGGGPLSDPGPDVVSGLGYGDVDRYLSLAPGSYAVSIRAAGSRADTPPALSARIDVATGSATTVTLSGPFEDVALQALPDDLSAPPAGSARVRVLTAAAGAGPVTVTASGRTVAEAQTFPDTGRYVDVPAGAAEIRLGTAGPLSVDLAAGSVVTLLVLDAEGGVEDGVEVRPVVDAAGAAVVPVGGVDAGTGPGTVPVGALLVVAAAAVRRIRVPLLVVAAAATVLVGEAGPAVATASEAVVSVEPEGTAQAPVRVRAPGMDAAVAGTDIGAAGTLAAPADPSVAGWFAGGTAPGDVGPAVLTAHVDWSGAPGAFAALDDLRPGDEVAVERADGSVVRFVVTRSVLASKAAFPTAEVYGPTAGAELRLITCGGRFDRAADSYEDNVVVFATQVT